MSIISFQNKNLYSTSFAIETNDFSKPVAFTTVSYASRFPNWSIQTRVLIENVHHNQYISEKSKKFGQSKSNEPNFHATILL